MIPMPDIKVVSTEHSLHFFPKDGQNVSIYRDEDEWEAWSNIQDPVLHIELRKWADVMLIAPLDANTLAKIANGICDNLLTCVVRAWDMQKPLLFAPAMNTFMYEHPITSTHIDLLKKFGYKEIPCISKKLACGDTGFGAMAEVATLVLAVEQAIPSINKNTGSVSSPSTSLSVGL
ncbi:hypothetical protein Btru_055207 [Bulinus truncatus]|nr:hypothetical protein Btru_055207 [Bulinus truncatus]